MGSNCAEIWPSANDVAMAAGSKGRIHSKFLTQLVGAKFQRVGEAWPNPLYFENRERPLIGIDYGGDGGIQRRRIT